MKKKVSLLTCIIIATFSVSGCSFNKTATNNAKPIENKTANYDSAHNTNNGQTNIELIAYNFFFSQSVITVNKNSEVNIVLSSADGQHDIFIEGYNIQSTVSDINNKSSLNFLADKAGEFNFYSTIGNQKDLGLVGKLIVK